MLDSNIEVEDGVGYDPGAEIWLAVMDGTCAVEDAVRARSGHESPRQVAVLAAICRPTPEDELEVIPRTPVRTAPVVPIRRRARTAMGVGALAVAACSPLLFILPGLLGPEDTAERDATLAADIERERRAVAGLTAAVESGHLVHLGAATTDELRTFSPKDVIKIRGTTTAMIPPRLGTDVVVRLGPNKLDCPRTAGDRAAFYWECIVPPVRLGSTSALKVCAPEVKHDETCLTIAAVEVVDGGDR